MRIQSRVRLWAAQEGRMQHAAYGNVVDEAPAPAKQWRVFDAAHPLADPALFRRLVHSPPRFDNLLPLRKP